MTPEQRETVIGWLELDAPGQFFPGDKREAVAALLAAHAALQRENAALRAALRDVAIRRGCSEWGESFQKCGICGASNDADAPLTHGHDCPLVDAALTPSAAPGEGETR